jgi:serine/threonine protein kinase
VARTCPECGTTYQDNILFCGEDGTPTVPEQPLESGVAGGEQAGRARVCPECNRRYPDTIFFCGHDGTITVQEQDRTDPDPLLGKQLGGYLVVARVADGAMGRVYEGRHPETKSRVAIKVLHQHVLNDQVAVERFKREYESASELVHPNVIKVLEFGSTDQGSHFMTMEYLVGEELGKVLKREGSLAKERMIRVVAQTALALRYAHSFGFIHRDLKPDNIFLCKSADGDVVRLLDFGSVKLQVETGAKLTALGTTLGSPYYMSPEQARGAADVDQRTDVFALSAIIYEMITGKVAFGAPNVAQILVKIMNETPPPASTLNPDSPQSVDDVIDKGLRKEKERRHESTVQLAEAFIAAYGLSGSAEQWATIPDSEIAAALQQAVPPAPRPFGALSVPPRTPSVPPPAVSRGSAASVSSRPPAATGTFLGFPKGSTGARLAMIGAGVLAAIAVGAVIVLLL